MIAALMLLSFVFGFLTARAYTRAATRLLLEGLRRNCESKLVITHLQTENTALRALALSALEPRLRA